MLVEAWYPVTKDFGLIHAPLENVVAGLVAWHADLGTHYKRREISSSFREALESLPPLSAEKHRRLFVPTASEWTACLQSGIDGSDPFPAMSFLSRKLGVLAIRVCCTPPDAKWPATIWDVYAPEKLGGTPPLGYRRSICAMNDGGRWVFEESGARYPFEKIENYELPRKRDRFTRELLVQYLSEFGISPFFDEFYVTSPDSPAVLLENCKRWPNPAPEYALAEVKAGLPWKKQ